MFEKFDKLFDIVRSFYEGPTKVSRTDRNVANEIDLYLRDKFPVLYDPARLGAHCQIWVTGSTVWKFLYNEVPDGTEDLDIVCENDATMESVLKHIGVNELIPSTKNYKDGLKTTLNDGRTMDIWSNPNIYANLYGYPRCSHGHCKAAYNPCTGELRVMPNPAAK